MALVEIDRPEKMNAFKDPMWENLATTCRKLDTDPDVRAIVLAGRGNRAFTAGLDVCCFLRCRDFEHAGCAPTNTEQTRGGTNAKHR